LKITPDTVKEGEETTVSVKVENTGELSGDYTVNMLIDNVFQESRARNTPTHPLYDLLRQQCRTVTIHDSYIKTDDAPVTDNLTEALTGANCLALVTAHKEYHVLDLDWLKQVMKTPIIVDNRYVFNPEKCRQAGFTYRGVGRRTE